MTSTLDPHSNTPIQEGSNGVSEEDHSVREIAWSGLKRFAVVFYVGAAFLDALCKIAQSILGE